ncbi:MAG: glutamine-synthetase adenylyltransferase [Alphaproteobacteria bacterium]|nr:glutamine-synthetase adenylyltransferase [Alphaproteobacteria bacterium]
MSLISKTTLAPISFEPALGREAAACLPDAPANVQKLLNGVGGCSPYLRGLIQREHAWLAQVLPLSPDQVLGEIHGAVTAESFDALARELRQAKRRVALYVALADTGGMWGLCEVTSALTKFADFAVSTALNMLLRAELARGLLPGCTEADMGTSCGLVVLAMGKMGAFELNYSSDIDLIVLFDETRHAPEDFDTIRQRFIRITRRMAKLLSDVTGDGYVFRTDLRLRPDPSVTPVCLSMAAAERYYESLGRTWERAAYIKARACAGDIRAGEAFLQTLRPFVWRKHLDYAAIQDAHDMRLRIREHKGLGGAIVLPGHNIKLGRGGIREIEFFTQTRQIIAGGRDVELRARATCEALTVLARKNWVSEEAASALIAAYEAHRQLEHRIQMLADAQTHDIPTQAQQIARLAAFCGVEAVSEFREDIIARLEMVHDLTESFFAPEVAQTPELPEISAAMRELMDKWHGLPALRSSRARSIFKRLEPLILQHLLATADPSETLNQFDGFLAGLPAGVQLFSLFEANPQLIDLLIEICGSAPGLARYLSRNSQVFDGVISGIFFQPVGDIPALSADLTKVLARLDDYEDKLNAARRWMKEQHFRIGVHHLKSMISSEQAAASYSDLAEAVLGVIFPAVTEAFVRRHGRLPGSEAVVLGMGSLGARSLTASSDLDLIVIYDPAGVEFSDGKKPLAASTYFARLTQALVTALSSPMSEGQLYEVDMRLRPSGRKGPVATAFSGFVSYQQTEAWTWEHLALTRARVVAGGQALGQKVEDFRCVILGQTRDPARTLNDVSDMRARLASASDAARLGDIWEAKQGPGRMLDIEMLAQAAALLTGCCDQDVLAQLARAQRLGWLNADEQTSLAGNYTRLRRVQQLRRLVGAKAFAAEAMGRGVRDLLLAETDENSIKALETRLETGRETSAALIDRTLESGQESGPDEETGR